MNQVLLAKILDINSPILITGPSGTGKSQLAKKIFKRSRIYRDNFLVVHLASIKEELFESELFGHRKGSFTGAVENKIGYFQMVGKGTLFLDEIGELSMESQKKLLYLLEEKKFTPVGSTTPLDFCGRILMATNKDLKKLVEDGQFREDLFFRLNIFQIHLDEIHLDKPKLLKGIYQQFELLKEKYQKTNLLIGKELEDLMMGARWKGNYRELKNFLEYMIVVSEGPSLKIEDLPLWFQSERHLSKSDSRVDFISQFPQDFNLAVENFESWYLRTMFNRFSGKVNETARILGISKTALIYKAKKYQINTLEIRAEASKKVKSTHEIT